MDLKDTSTNPKAQHLFGPWFKKNCKNSYNIGDIWRFEHLQNIWWFSGIIANFISLIVILWLYAFKNMAIFYRYTLNKKKL